MTENRKIAKVTISYSDKFEPSRKFDTIIGSRVIWDNRNKKVDFGYFSSIKSAQETCQIVNILLFGDNAILEWFEDEYNEYKPVSFGFHGPTLYAYDRAGIRYNIDGYDLDIAFDILTIDKP